MTTTNGKAVTEAMVEAALKKTPFPINTTTRGWMTDALSAALSAQEKPEAGVMIKPLEWDIFGQAHSIVGVYDVVCIAQGGVFGLILPGHSDDTFPYSREGSEAECRDAAQSDFEQRIRSALVPPPPVQDEPVAWLVHDKLYRDQVFLDRQGAQNRMVERDRDSLIIPLYLHPAPASEVGIPEGYVLVPQTALDWLFGEGVDADGQWFGEAITPRAPSYWWRTHFRKLIAASPSPDLPEGER